MTRRPRRNHRPAFEAKVALVALRGEQTLLELSQQSTCTPIRLNSGKTNGLQVRLAYSEMNRKPGSDQLSM